MSSFGAAQARARSNYAGCQISPLGRRYSVFEQLSSGLSNSEEAGSSGSLTCCMRLIYVLVFALSLILTGAAILEWGAAELQKDWREVAFLTLIDAGWLIVATKLFSCLGLSLRDDAVDRKNTAALVALCGALLGVAFTYL